MKISTSVRLKTLMDERNLRQTDILTAYNRIAKTLGEKEICKSAISQYVHGFVEPKQDKLVILGIALDVSEGWLMGLDVPRERTRSEPPYAPFAALDRPQPQTIDETTAQFIELFMKLSSENRARILDLIKALLTAQ